MEKLIIEEDKWLRGEGSMASRLLRPADGKMCCLGFLALQCGYTEEQISDYSAPKSIVYDYGGKPKGSFEKLVSINTDNHHRSVQCTNICERLMEANDDQSLSNIGRKCRISELFKEINIEVEFV